MDFQQPETKIVKISNGVWAFDQEMVRCFLIVGSRHALLFDTGAAPFDILGTIASITSLPVTLVHSHGDGDHTANDAAFSAIYAHPAEFPVITRFRPELKDRLHPVTGISSYDLGGRTLQVIETPGHTPGSISLLDCENRILFSGDTVSYGPVFMFGAHRDLAVYRSTLEQLRDMQSFDTVYPCHNQCPVSLSVISSLIEISEGIADGSLQGTVPSEPMPDNAAPLLYSIGKCGILYNPNEKESVK